MLEATGVDAGYGDSTVVFDLNFTVRAGEVVSLVGRNGAGKSTTLKTIVRLVMPSRGRIVFKGTDLGDSTTHRIARLGIGYVPEERRIFAKLTVEENLLVTRDLGGGAGRWPVERAYALFPKLAELRRRSADLLSGGEQQMLCIARTLMGNPSLVLLDEPSEGLAPVIVEGLCTQILEMKRQGLTILLCEQNLAFARALSDRLYVIDRGSICFEGTFRELDGRGDVLKRHLLVGQSPREVAASP